MELEARQVLHSRWRVLGEWRDKEWWYTGFHDPASGAYVSWYFIRVNFCDEFAFTVFDPTEKAPAHFERKLFLDRPRIADGLSLVNRGRELQVEYEGRAEQGWSFRMKSGGFEADLQIASAPPAFTKFDNELVDRYGLLHLFQNRATGTVRTPGRSYRLDGALGYYDHCFGRVPANSGWHWVALWNEEVALASLVNYGVYPQRYTQVLFRKGVAERRPGEWIRLDQDVSFEQAPGHAVGCPWSVTSCELELEVMPLQSVSGRERIPPLVPFLVDIRHSELFVKAKGRVRVDGRWFETGELVGVMEQHHGRW